MDQPCTVQLPHLGLFLADSLREVDLIEETLFVFEQFGAVVVEEKHRFAERGTCFSEGVPFVRNGATPRLPDL